MSFKVIKLKKRNLNITFLASLLDQSYPQADQRAHVRYALRKIKSSSPIIVLIMSHLKNNFFLSFVCFLFFGFFFVCLFVLVFTCGIWKYGSSQARGPSRAIATSLHHSHSNRKSEPRLGARGNTGSPTHRMRPGIKSSSSWILVRFVSAMPLRGL